MQLQTLLAAMQQQQQQQQQGHNTQQSSVGLHNNIIEQIRALGTTQASLPDCRAFLHSVRSVYVLVKSSLRLFFWLQQVQPRPSMPMPQQPRATASTAYNYAQVALFTVSPHCQSRRCPTFSSYPREAGLQEIVHDSSTSYETARQILYSLSV